VARIESNFLAFNRGLVSRLALARVDLKRLAWSCETMENWVPRAFGSMMLRPGWKYTGATRSNLRTRTIPFIRSSSAKHRIEFSEVRMRVWTDETLLERVAVTAVVQNAHFPVNLNNWTDADESGASSVWVAGGHMGLTGTGTNAAIRRQQVTVNEANTEHALRIGVNRGPVVLRVGSSAGADDYVSQKTLATGEHSLAFTPTGASFWIQFQNTLERQVIVDFCFVEVAGEVAITTPYQATDLDNIRTGPDSQSIDVMFVGCTGYSPRRIERHSARSWSFVQYLPEDGPFRTENTSRVTITPSGLTGNITLTSSRPIFYNTHAPNTDSAGALFSITSQGQAVEQTITAQNTFTNAIRVTGVDAGRVFTIVIDEDSGGSATYTLQRSLESEDGPWTDVLSRTADTTETYDDTLDNQIAWYRIGVKTGDYGSGTHEVSLSYTSGSITGVVRITGWTSGSLVDAEVLSDLGGTAATPIWAEGEWSRLRGFPSAAALYEARAWWAGLDKEWGSITDAFDSFDAEFEGDAGPISRSIGAGPVETINWLLPLQRLMAGGMLQEFASRSSGFDEPLTPTNFNIKPSSGQGSAPVQAVKIDDNAVFVQRGGTRLFELEFDVASYNYKAKPLNLLNPEVCKPRVIRLAVQRQPDTRIHCVLSDGTVAMLVYDPAENVACWFKVTTDGVIEDVCVLPGDEGDDEDEVYYTVWRTINGSVARYHEKWALESECVGGTLNKQADAFLTFTNSTASATVSGLTHLVGEEVICWFDGICEEDDDGFPQTYTVSASGTITLGQTASTGIVGLAYTAPWKSSKLAESVTKYKRIDHLGVVLADTHPKGLYYGRDLDNLDPLPEIEEGAPVDQDAVWEDYDQPPFEFDGDWDADSRLCMKAYAPRPVTVLAAAIHGEVHG
jgi:hypothetical protein